MSPQFLELKKKRKEISKEEKKIYLTITNSSHKIFSCGRIVFKEA